MLNLTKEFQLSLPDPTILYSTITLLENTSVYVDIFSNINSKLESMSDTRIQKLLKVLDFFHSWENQFATQKEQGQHLISRQTQEDIDCSIYGFIQIAHVAMDLIQGLHNGFNQNPSLHQIGPCINSNLISGSIVSAKGNTGGSGYQYKGVVPPSKKIKL